MTPKLPPLPEASNDNRKYGRAGFHSNNSPAYTAEQMDDRYLNGYSDAIAAIEAQGVPDVEEIRRVLECVKSSVDAGMRVTDGWRILESLLASAPPAPQAKPQPLTREQVKGLCESAGYDLASPVEQADFINGIRHGEVAHGIEE